MPPSQIRCQCKLIYGFATLHTVMRWLLLQHCKTHEKCTQIYQTVCETGHYGYEQTCQQVPQQACYPETICHNTPQVHSISFGSTCEEVKCRLCWSIYVIVQQLLHGKNTVNWDGYDHDFMLKFLTKSQSICLLIFQTSCHPVRTLQCQKVAKVSKIEVFFSRNLR
jgi:hypothetical protein